MNARKANNNPYWAYEEFKKQLDKQNLTPAQRLKAIRDYCKKAGI